MRRYTMCKFLNIKKEKFILCIMLRKVEKLAAKVICTVQSRSINFEVYFWCTLYLNSIELIRKN